MRSFWYTVHWPDWCRDHSRGFPRPVFPALGTYVRQAALSVFHLLPQLPPLYHHHFLRIRLGCGKGSNVSHLRSCVSFCHCWAWWLVCVCLREREREREKQGKRGESESNYAREGWREYSCVYDWFSEGVWGDREWVRDRSLLGAIKIATTTWEITVCLLDTPHLY